jgi:hypothetical protein
MSPAAHICLAVQLALGAQGPEAGARPAECETSAAVEALSLAAVLDAARTQSSRARSAAEPRTRPGYQPTAEEWIDHVAGRLAIADAQITRAARWAATFPVRVRVQSDTVSVGLSIRTP